MTFPETAARYASGTVGDLDYHAILTGRPSPRQQAALAANEADMARGHPRYGTGLDGWIILLADARRPTRPLTCSILSCAILPGRCTGRTGWPGSAWSCMGQNRPRSCRRPA